MTRTRAVDALLRAMPNEGAVLEAGTVTAVNVDGEDPMLTVLWDGTTIANVPAIGDGVDVGDRVWLLRSGNTLIALVGGAAIEAGLTMKGSVETVNDLPPEPHEHGDGWIVQETGNVWVWIIPPGEFQDFGPLAATYHDALLNIEPDQHHAKSHTHDGVDGSGTVGHASLAGVTPDQHHDQQHDLYGGDHGDVETTIALTPRVVLAQRSVVGDWAPETRMNWRSQWDGGIHYRHDVVRDGDWTMVANKETVDPPAPQPLGDPSFLLPDVPLWVDDTETATVRAGIRFTVSLGRLILLTKLRFWVFDTSPDMTYQWWTENNVTGQITMGLSFHGDIVAQPGWVEFSGYESMAGGASHTVMLSATKSASSTRRDGVWRRQADSQNDPPAIGHWRTNNQSTLLRINYFDEFAVDQSWMLDEVIPATVIRAISQANTDLWQEWTVASATDTGSAFEYDVSLDNTGPGGAPASNDVCDFQFDIPSPDPLLYGALLEWWAANQTIESTLQIGDGSPVIGQDGYGIDAEFTEYLASDDWDLLALSRSGGSSGGGDGETSPHDLAGSLHTAAGQPPEYVSESDGSDGVRWVPRVTDHDDLANVTPDQHHAELHDLTSHTNVQAVGPADGQYLAWDATQGQWVPRRSQSALGFVEFDYRFDTSNDDTPAIGEIQYNHDDPAIATIMYVHEEDRAGNDETLFWDEVKTGDWLNLHDPDDVDGRFQAFDVIATPTKVGNVYHIPITLFSQAGADFNNNFKIRAFVRFVAVPPFSGDHTDLSNVLPDQHHVRYSDSEAIAAVGPHFSGVHGDLTGVGPSDHHVRYDDDEARAATLDHFVQVNAPASPTIGTVWVNPDEPPEATYLPLTGGTLTGPLTLASDPVSALHAATKQYVDNNIIDTWKLLSLQNGWAAHSPTRAQPQYRLERGGVVRIRGLIAGGTTSASTVLANIPVGYRPPLDLLLGALSNHAFLSVDILSNGDLRIGGSTASATWIAINLVYSITP